MQLSEEIRRLDSISGGFQRSQVLFTAMKGNVFVHLEEPRSAEEIAEAAGWSLRGTRMLLDGLLALHLVNKEDGRYRNAPIASQCLVPGAPMDQTSILRHKAYGWSTWSRLEEAVRTGKPAMREEERSDEELRAFICGMRDIAAQSAQGVLEKVDLSGCTRLLDAGTGPGTYSIVFLQRHPALHATLFDRPEVITIAREQVEQAGLMERVAFLPGDLMCDPLGSGYDLALVSNIIHSFDPETNRALVAKCYGALEPGGLLIIKDFLLDPERTGPPFGLMFALHMFVHTEGGDAYTVDEVAEWTRDAGFQEGELVDLTPQTRLWLVRK